MKLFIQKKYHSEIILLVGFLLGGLAFWGISQLLISHNALKFPLTNPSLKYTELREVLMANKTLNMSGALTKYINAQKANGTISQLSIYFRNLNNGGRFGINEKDYFSPASLMKLPILLAYMKKSEAIPGFLDQKVVYKKSEISETYRQNIPAAHVLEDGLVYTWREILENLIIYSDNDSAAFLTNNIPLAEIKQTFADVSLPFPQYSGGSFDNNITVLDYATFFRKLYNASYLSMESSEKVLDLLSKVAFTEGLVAGIPSNITVSHKFGERGIIGENDVEEKQLHDCGIVYYPQYPYVLCVMTRGYSFSDLAKTIANISKLVYGEVNNVYNLDTTK